MSKLTIQSRTNPDRVWIVEYRSRSYYLSSTVSGEIENKPKRYPKAHIEGVLNITLEQGAAGYTRDEDGPVLSKEENESRTEYRISKLSNTAKVTAARIETEKTKNLQVEQHGNVTYRRSRRPRVLRKLKAHLYNARQTGQFDREREIRKVIKQVRAGA